MRLNKILTIDDLILAFIEFEQFRDWKSSNELSEYYKTQLELFQHVFECDFKKAKKRIDEKRVFDDKNPEAYYEFNGRSTISLFLTCIELLYTTKTPFDFDGVVEGMPPKISRDLRDFYGPALEENIVLLEVVYRKIARDVLMFLFPGIEEKHIHGKDLYKLGLPLEIPDPCDFF